MSNYENLDFYPGWGEQTGRLTGKKMNSKADSPKATSLKEHGAVSQQIHPNESSLLVKLAMAYGRAHIPMLTVTYCCPVGHICHELLAHGHEKR